MYRIRDALNPNMHGLYQYTDQLEGKQRNAIREKKLNEPKVAVTAGNLTNQSKKNISNNFQQAVFVKRVVTNIPD